MIKDGYPTEREAAKKKGCGKDFRFTSNLERRNSNNYIYKTREWFIDTIPPKKNGL